MTPRVLAVPEPLRDALAVHEAYRKLGFSSNEIFLSVSPDGIQVILRAQEREFVFDVGPRSLSESEYRSLCVRSDFADVWRQAVGLWNGGTEAERQWIWKDARILDVAFEMVSKMVEKGFVLPRGGAWD